MQRKRGYFAFNACLAASISAAGSISHYGYNFLVKRTDQSIA
ncbi:hypothetical protein [Bartonella sp. MU70NMGDW]